jgi:hypothetical protein
MNQANATAAVRIAASTAIFFLLVLARLNFNDYLTRLTDPVSFRAPPSVAAPR